MVKPYLNEPIQSNKVGKNAKDHKYNKIKSWPEKSNENLALPTFHLISFCKTFSHQKLKEAKCPEKGKGTGDIRGGGGGLIILKFCLLCMPKLKKLTCSTGDRREYSA